MMCVSMLLCGASTAYAVTPQAFTGCVYDKTTNKAVKGAAIQIWTLPTGGGGVCGATTDATGCFSGCNMFYQSQTGGFIEASATLRGHHYRQQYLIPPFLGVPKVDYHYDFYFDTLPPN